MHIILKKGLHMPFFVQYIQYIWAFLWATSSKGQPVVYLHWHSMTILPTLTIDFKQHSNNIWWQFPYLGHKHFLLVCRKLTCRHFLRDVLCVSAGCTRSEEQENNKTTSMCQMWLLFSMIMDCYCDYGWQTGRLVSIISQWDNNK